VPLVPETEIVCVDCGGRCFLLTPPREDGIWLPGDIVTYRCQDCRDRWDLLLPDEDTGAGDMVPDDAW
jgi:DNA-directed RNA polymerase subunit RPC12/RpoP